MNASENNELLVFLKELHTSIENNTIDPIKIKSINEFRSMYEFVPEHNIHMITEIDDEEVRYFIKFLLVSCFIYRLGNLSHTQNCLRLKN
jgi:hypothetical protein